MKSAEDVRAENLERLLSMVPGRLIKNLADRIGKSPSQVSRWLPGNKNQKAISSESAREIEKAFNLPTNWLDQDRSGSPSGASLDLADSAVISFYRDDDPVLDEEFEVPSVNVRVGAGNRIHTDPIVVERRFRYLREWAIRYGLRIEKLIRYRVQGTSMEPVIQDGSWITVELDPPCIKDGRPYLIRSGDQIMVKYLWRRPDGGVIIRSHNPSDPDIVVPVSEIEHVSVIGEVVESSTMWRKPVVS